MLLLQKQQTIGEIRYGAFAPFLEKIYIFLYKLCCATKTISVPMTIY
jgi:hypothetical protein